MYHILNICNTTTAHPYYDYLIIKNKKNCVQFLENVAGEQKKKEEKKWSESIKATTNRVESELELRSAT